MFIFKPELVELYVKRESKDTAALKIILAVTYNRRQLLGIFGGYFLPLKI